ncbi:MAG: phenylalanine--tRNA ligase subunit alpha [bacterium]
MSSPLIEKIGQLRRQGEEELQGIRSEQDAQELKTKYVGKKGLLTHLLKELAQVPPEQKPLVGQAVNDFKVFFEEGIGRFLDEQKKKALAETLSKEKIDITLPGRTSPLGHVHPVTKVMDEVRSFFLRSGFDVHGGPEIETDYYNFEALGIPPNHPARDMQDTFYLSQEGTPSAPFVLRTHTSPVQVHVMESQKPPIRMIAPGAVYRRDSDVSHTPMFHQVEGLWVDEGISMAHLKGILTQFLHAMFGESVKLQFRPSYFPFTEPSAEVDIACVICKGGGCRVCKGTGWLEIMGCGMVDPVVFESVKIDPEVYTGFAFGMGIERIAMLKYGIDDIRLFFENDVRFLEQF